MKEVQQLGNRLGNRPARSLFAALGLAILAGCGSGAPVEKFSDELTGDCKVNGSSTVFPISEAAAEDFQKSHAKVKIVVGEEGTGNGFTKFVKGEIDICDASRPIKADEFAKCQEGKIDFLEIPVAYDGLSFVIHPENDWCKELTLDQLKRIFLDIDPASKWNELDPNWPETPIKRYSPGTGSGTYDYFMEVAAKGNKDAKAPKDVSMSEDDNVLVTGVAGDKGAIGYFGCAYYFNNKDKVRLVPIVNPATSKAVTVTPETVMSGEYAPFSRPLFIYVASKSLQKPHVRKFVEFYQANAGKFAEAVDYVALPKEIGVIAAQVIKEGKTGTAYLNAEGKPASGSLLERYKIENFHTIAK